MRIDSLVKNAKFNSLKNQNFKGINNPKVSVILPIYNQEKYLSSAIDSLRLQSLDDTEFICVNDGSTDSTPTILKSYAEKDKRVKVINQKNRGSGAARNVGLAEARGEYIGFLDPDDTLAQDALEKLYIKSKKDDSDMVVFNFKRVNEDGTIRWKSSIQDIIGNIFTVCTDKTFNWRNIKPKALDGLYWMVWNKLYKNDFVRNSGLRFSDCCLAEDNLFTIGATLNAREISYTPEYFYNYIRHKNTAVHKLTDKNLCIFNVIDDVKKLLEALGLSEELKDEFDKYVLTIMTYHAKQIISQDKLQLLCRQQLSPKQIKMLEEQKLI